MLDKEKESRRGLDKGGHIINRTFRVSAAGTDSASLGFARCLNQNYFLSLPVNSALGSSDWSSLASVSLSLFVDEARLIERCPCGVNGSLALAIG